MKQRIVGLIILMVFFAWSFLMLVNLPYSILGTHYETLVYVVWFIVFAVSFAKVGLER